MILKFYPILSTLAVWYFPLPSTAHLQWLNITNALERGALCNDFSTAGYFIHRHHLPSNATGSKWVIFLEGGGGCTTPRSCNVRFIHQSIRNNYSSSSMNGSRFVDVEQAWVDYSNDQLAVTSRLMTSLWRFSEQSRINRNTWIIEGKAMLSTNSAENPDFYDYNHVVIPYCSSDLWLKRTNDFDIAQNTSFKFTFDPSAKHHQFTFRGAAIFESVILDLFNDHGLDTAAEVILAGSSAGGVGAMNHAPWLKQELFAKARPEAMLYCLMDSSWFIDFRGSIQEQFNVNEIQALVESGEIVDTCTGIAENPSVCISSPRFFTNFKDTMKDIPTFALFSRYDLYLLISSLEDVGMDVLELMRIGSEYSGSMNASLKAAVSETPNLSYYVTSCFQHVYLATSTLWGENGILGTAAIDGNLENNYFEHRISSEVWTKFHLEHLNSSLKVEHISIMEAIHNWLEAAKSGVDVPIRYQDYCGGPHCNLHCPETIALGRSNSYWESETQGVLLAIVVLVSLSCVVVKVLFIVWGRYHCHKQRQFVEWNTHSFDDESESALPYCGNSDAISVACLNLRYSVTLRKSDLRKACSPAQRKRILSLAAVESESVRVWRCDAGEDGLQRLDSETGQPVEENDFAKSIRQFQEIHNQKKLKIQFSRWKQRKDSNQGEHKKNILKGITTYFNPGELVAIMGPSGCGKTTFLDLLAGRRNDRESYEGELMVNGIPMDEIRDWYIANTGYVLQLATPYYEELTVRENITLAAQMRLPKTLSLDKHLERVEQVMRETGLYSLADTVVGGATGPGLSGGQKRRLCVALQLVSMPSLIFLDEPTSGLDAGSSLELLSHLHRVASSNRAVILTIHQPRLEIFHMFHKVILLCQGQIAYHGIPDKAYEVFLEANQVEGRMTDSLESKNPADVIIDMLGSEEARAAILSYYQASDEPDAVESAIKEVCSTGQESVTSNQVWTQRNQQKSGIINRMLCLESRASKRAGLGQMIYLPLIFTIYGTLLGTVYVQTTNATFILSGYGVFSCASGLFMFPIVSTYLHRALEIFSLEYSDGVGSPMELVLQTFLRFTSLAFIPNLVCSTILYLLAIPYSLYEFRVFAQITLITLSINQTWIALITFVVTARPDFAHRISPVLSAIAGFAGGFFVPPRLMPPWYSWLFYINPNYYGFSAMARLLLQDIDLGCEYQSPIECYPSSAAYILTYFDLHTVNPYLHLVILLTMTAVLLGLAWLSLTYRHYYILPQIKRLFRKKYPTAGPMVTKKAPVTPPTGSEPRETRLAMDLQSSDETSINHKDEEFSVEFKKVTLKAPLHRLSLSVEDSLGEKGSLLDQKEEEIMERNRRLQLRNRPTLSRMLHDGENHQVWTPGAEGPAKCTPHSSQISLEDRRKSLFQRINTYRSGSGGFNNLQSRHSSKDAPNRDNVARRMAQWKKIEDEAKKLEEIEDAELKNSCDDTHKPLPSIPLQLTPIEGTMTTQSMPSLYPQDCTPSSTSPLASSHQKYKEQLLKSLGVNYNLNSRGLGISNLGAIVDGSQSTMAPMPIAIQQLQPQFFIFPEVPSSVVELMPRDSQSVSTPDTGGVSNLSSSYESSYLSCSSLPQIQNVLNLHTPGAYTPTNITPPPPHKSLPPHAASQPHPVVSVVQMQNTKQTMSGSGNNQGIPGSPLVVSLPTQDMRPSVSVMDAIIEETDSEGSTPTSSLSGTTEPLLNVNMHLSNGDSKADQFKSATQITVDNNDKIESTPKNYTDDEQAVVTDLHNNETGQQIDTLQSNHITDCHTKIADHNQIERNEPPSAPSISKIEIEPFKLPRTAVEMVEQQKLNTTHQPTGKKIGLSNQHLLHIREGLCLKYSPDKERDTNALRKHKKCQCPMGKFLPQQAKRNQLLALSPPGRVATSAQEAVKPQRGNKSATFKKEDVTYMKGIANRKPIPVSSPTHPMILASPRQNTFQSPIYEQTNKDPMATQDQPLYVVRSPTTKAKIANAIKGNSPHTQYQQTDF